VLFIPLYIIKND